ncbi:hypothetical protein [Afifella marina]|nr:hypothetical protein [Afifella marina]
MFRFSFFRRLAVAAFAALPAFLMPVGHAPAPAQLRGPIEPPTDGTQSPEGWRDRTIFREARHIEFPEDAEKRLS